MKIHLLSCELSLQTKESIIRHSGLDPAELQFHDIYKDDLDKEGFSLNTLKPSIMNHVTLATYARLLIDRIDFDTIRVIYLDADTIVLSDLTPLWTADLGPYTLGAVQDPGVMTLGAYKGVQRQDLTKGAPESKYFNAGMMLIDLARARESKLFKRARAYLKAAGNDILLLDQEALNAAAGGDYQELSINWNLMSHSPFKSEYLKSAKIRHFCSDIKPWDDPAFDEDSHRYFANAPKTWPIKSETHPRTGI